jgi:hypothetical protein
MAASITELTGALIAETEASQPRGSGRRRISPKAGRALEILSHAIEYLADEYVHRGKTFSAEDPEVQAVKILMALNRQIYFEYPVLPSFAQRLRGWLRIPIGQG